MLQFISLPLKVELISDTTAQLIQNSITSYHKNQERTRKKTRKEKRENNRSHDWKKKAPNLCCSVSFQSWMDQWNCSEVNIREKFFEKSLPNIGSKMWFRFDVSWKIVSFIVQSGLKLQYNFSIEDGEWKRTKNVVVTGSETADGMCQNNNESNILLTLHYNLFVWTFGAAWTQSYINCR